MFARCPTLLWRAVRNAVEVPAATRAHYSAVVEPQTTHPPLASWAQEKAPGAAVRKVTVLEPHFAFKLDRAKADPDARHTGGYRALSPKARNVGRNRKRFQQQPVRGHYLRYHRSQRAGTASCCRARRVGTNDGSACSKGLLRIDVGGGQTGMRAPYSPTARPRADARPNPALPVPRIDHYPQRAHIDHLVLVFDQSLSQPLLGTGCSWA